MPKSQQKEKTMKELFVSLALIFLVATSANAATRCTKDYFGNTVCKDSQNRTVMRCHEDYFGAIVCK